ncbi:MAG: His/Gly/Thr/Pro-type tRNA ligase C-terminal domain-containing protein [Myxococcota bacterium]|nr:His/Gly/Thr/Pro-type tRNA ligase C-terminal domain-containing protein [Myxococcota bacterium]
MHDAHLAGVPFVAVVGKREAADGSLSLRERGGQVRSLSLEAALCRLVQASFRDGDRR